MFSKCLATSRWMFSGTTLTLEKSVCKMFNSSVSCSTRFCRRSLSRTNNFNYNNNNNLYQSL